MVLFPGLAQANPRPLPFTYPYETLPKGASEIELYGDVTPNRVYVDDADPSKGRLWEPRYTLQTEIEHGITDRWEIGFYQVFEAEPISGGTNAFHFDGFKWRIRHRFAEAGELPIDIALYFELETMHDEIALEGKVLLSKRFGRLRWMANLWVEEAFDRPFDGAASQAKFIVNPTTGFTYEATPTVHPGIEYWARGELAYDTADPIDAINRRVHHFVGPVFHANFGSLWWTLGAYADLNNINKPQVGEVYGPVWVRSVLGINL